MIQIPMENVEVADKAAFSLAVFK